MSTIFERLEASAFTRRGFRDVSAHLVALVRALSRTELHRGCLSLQHKVFIEAPRLLSKET
jgi:hypothetical protein